MKKYIAIFGVSLTLLGCQAATKPLPAVKPLPPVESVSTIEPTPEPPYSGGAFIPVPAPHPKSAQDETTLPFCLKELDALKQVDATKYQAKSSELNHLLKEAKNYVQVRNSLNNDMNVILDSAFQYRIARTCNDIRVALTQSLLQRIEQR